MKRILAGIVALVLGCGAGLWAFYARAGVTCSLPYTLTNGTTADASQVMANYNALVTCLANAAAAGANNDITSLSGLTTPLTPAQGGSNVYLGSSVTVSGAEIIIGATTPSGYAQGLLDTVIFAATATNSGATTINVNSQGIENVYKQSTAGPIPLTGNEIVPNQVYVARWDGTQYQINPVPSVAAGWGLAQNASATQLQINTTNPPYGFEACVNARLSVTVTNNLLSLSLLAADSGAAPSASHPVLCPFRDSTLTAGDPVWLAITSALTMNSNAVGATLGVPNNTPFRFWVGLFDNAGTPVFWLFNAMCDSVSGGIEVYGVNPIDDTALQSSTAISAASTACNTYYTPNGTTITSQPIRILGYLEYSAGLATSGTYGSGPSKVQLYGPGVKKPGDVIQVTAQSLTTNQFTILNTAFVPAGPSQSIVPQSYADLFRVYADVSYNGNTNVNGFLTLARGTTPNQVAIGYGAGLQGPGSGATPEFPIHLMATDIVSAASVSYSLIGKGSNGASSFGSCGQISAWTLNYGCSLYIEEIQG